MKNILALFIVIISFRNANAQQWRSVPEKKDNAVRVHGVTFQDAVRKLISMSYRLDKIDSNYQTIQVNIDKLQTMYIHFDTAHNMIITSDLNDPGNIFLNHAPVVYFKSAFNRGRWDEMMKYAGSFSNVEYAKL
jgi:hypothetical protein